MSYCIAIDGPAGAGKSTIAKLLAKKLQLIYVDTGAMYRAMAFFLIREKVLPQQADLISRKCQEAKITIGYENGEQVVYLNGENVTAFLRTEEIGNMASKSSVNPQVREKLVELQQELASKEDVVMDGRDIGTKVLPNANIKIYLTASSEVRAKRRYKELVEKGETADLVKIEADIIERDDRDMNREISPLKKAEDAIVLDTSFMTIDQAVDAIISICQEKGR